MKHLTYELSSKVMATTFLREGGVSEGAFSSLNVGDAVGDCLEAVCENRKRVKECLNLSHVAFARQVHGKETFEVTRQNVFVVPTCDLLFTKEKNIGLCIQHADCQAALFVDEEKEVIAAVHAGWKGLALEAYKTAIEFFVKNYQSNVKNLRVVIAPSLGPCHAEFLHYREEFPKSFWPFQVKPFFFDLRKIAKEQLKKNGILDEHIYISDECTYDQKENFYSYRREKSTGRHATVIALL